MEGQGGQATVEWVALVLVAACALLAVGLGVRGSARGEGLGEEVAARVVCGARTVAEGGGRCRTAPTHRPSLPSIRAAPVPGRAAGVQRLRGVSEVAKRVWVVCLGYKRLRYEREHPRTSGEPMPLDEALQIANDCFNPLSFLGAG
jgi:hypothetical protein